MSTLFSLFFPSFFKNFSVFIIIFPKIGKKCTPVIKKCIDKPRAFCYT